MEHADGTPVTVSAPLPLEPEQDQRPPALQRPAPDHLTPMVTDRGFQHLPPIRYLFKAADAAQAILEQWRESGPRVGETTPPEGPTDA